MSKYEWLETFELRVPEIDGDHRSMLDLMKAVRVEAHAGRKARTAAALDRLIAFSKEHFQREEAFLASHGYGSTNEHTEYHGELLDRAVALKETCCKLVSPDEIEGCCDELMSYIVDDIVKGDMQLKSFLQEAKLTLPA